VTPSGIEPYLVTLVSTGEGGCVHRGLMGKPLGQHMCRWNDNMKVDLQEVECRCVDWIRLAQVRDSWWVIVNAVSKLQVA
jgi:hypothetical protein